jgi:hypothetical protein
MVHVFVWRERKIGLGIKIFCLLVVKKVSLCFSCKFCLFLLNFNHILDLGFHHMLDRRVVRVVSLFPQMRLFKMIRYCLSYLPFHV